MKFLVFSDLHAHNFKYGSETVSIDGFKGVYNSRLRDTAAVLDEIRETAKREGIKYVLFGGDLYHKRTFEHTDVKHVVTSKLFQMVEDGLELHMILGNHDMGDRMGYSHHLNEISAVAGINVYTETTFVQLDGVNLAVIPYVDFLAVAKDKLSLATSFVKYKADPYPTVLLAHLGMKGARLGGNLVYLSDSTIQVSDVSQEVFDLCLFGHFHEHQKVFKNGWFIGATHEHNWGDSGGSRGFLVCEVTKDHVSLEQHATSAPRFIKIKAGEDTSHVKLNDFVTIHGERSPVLEGLSKHVQFIAEETDVEEAELALTNLDIAEAIAKWAEVRGGSLDPDLVKKEGLRILRKAS